MAAARSVTATLSRTSPSRAAACVITGDPPSACAMSEASSSTLVARPVPMLTAVPASGVVARSAHAIARAVSDTWMKSRVCSPSP